MIDFTPPPKIPSAVIKYADSNMIKERDDGGIVYIMKWNGQKIYCPYLSRYKTEPKYSPIAGQIMLGYNGKTVHRINDIKEYLAFKSAQEKYYDKNSRNCYKKLNYKLEKNKDKDMFIGNYYDQSYILSKIYDYANKYIMKHNNIHIDYLYEWNGKKVYRVYYCIKRQAYPHQKILIVYDGKVIRRATPEEMNIFCHECSDYYYYTLFNKRKVKND